MLTDETRRRDFPSLKSMVYLNTAAEGIPPRAVAEAFAQYVEDKALGMDGRERHAAQWAEAKRLTAAAYGLSTDEIGICSCSSEAFNLLALALSLGENDEVIINDLDFPAGATPWLQPPCRATVKVWRAREGSLRIEDLESLLTSRTRLVVLSLVSFYNGYKMRLEAVAASLARSGRALLAVDVTQALGRIPLAHELEEADFVVSSTHKWILASHGGGLVGIPSRRATEITAKAGGWFNLENAFDSDRFERAVTRPGAASFTVGMPNYPAVYAIRAGLAYVSGLGIDRIDEYARPLVRSCLEGLRRLPVELLAPYTDDTTAGIIAFRHADAERIHRELHDQDIHIMAHAGRLRVAIHLYNTMSDIERLLESLGKAIHRG
jgi:cysteine desulfurase / selenocysteine lyase